MRLILCMLAALLPSAVWALGPHEVLLLVNEQSPPSVALGEWYAHARGIPDQNIVRITVPERAVVDDSISANVFKRRIWEPATAAMQARGLEGHILAWVYSVGFPVRINTSPATSITGMTFLRNRFPLALNVEGGRYVSPIFGGPSSSRDFPHRAQTLDSLAEWIGRDMPMPAMMLGYMGKRNGNTMETIRACLRLGMAADGTIPTGTVYFVQTDDIRSAARTWEHGGAIDDLRKLGVQARIVPSEPLDVDDVLGIQMGSPFAQTTGKRYLPGAMAEHLTSWGAIFSNDSQTTLTAWIAAGVTASAGTVVEPYALWTKFPNAHFFYYYASGCTMLESFYQSIRSPLQILLVGEPLASPWKPRDRLRLEGLASETLNQAAEVRPVEESQSGFDYRLFKYYLDGREVHQGRTWTLDPADLPPGNHSVRVVGYRTGLVRQQIYADARVIVPGKSGTENSY